MITLPANFEADIQGQNLNLFPIVSIKTLPDLSLFEDSGVDLQYDLNIESTSFFVAIFGLRGGDYIKIDQEYMRVLSIVPTGFGGSPPLVIFVVRGLFGSLREFHSSGENIHRSTENPYNISTKNVTLSGTHYKPLLLNIPSIKESMDFENRNYKISNVTLKISNYEYEGERFSDYAGNLINASVVISWVSQSESILEVYKGFIRRYSDDEIVTLTLEDATQKDLHQDVPVARLGDGDEIPDKYKNKPIPMVYGEIDYSPCVISSNLELGEIYISADSTDTISFPANMKFGSTAINKSPLWVFFEEMINVSQVTGINLSSPSNTTHTQFTITDPSFVFGADSANIEGGIIEFTTVRPPDMVKFGGSPEVNPNSAVIDGYPLLHIIDQDNSTYMHWYHDMVESPTSPSMYPDESVFMLKYNSPAASGVFNNVEKINTYYLNHSRVEMVAQQGDYPDSVSVNYFLWFNVHVGNEITEEGGFDEHNNLSGSDPVNGFPLAVDDSFNFSNFLSYIGLSGSNAVASVDVKIWGVEFYQVFEYDLMKNGIIALDFYATVNGRADPGGYTNDS